MDRVERISVALVAVVTPLLWIAAFADGGSADPDARPASSIHAQGSAIHQQAAETGVVPSIVAPAVTTQPVLAPTVIVAKVTEPAPPGQVDIGRYAGASRPLAPGAFARTVPLGASKPVRLSIPAIGVDTGLIPLGLLRDGSLEVPPDGFPAGWYTGAPTPGELGPAVLAGHVDWLGPAVFHDLGRLKVGALVTVGRADRSVVTFVVTKVGQYPKDKFPTDAVYGNINFPGLRLITCGGVFNKKTGHYVDNVVVFAKLVAYTPGG